MTVETIISFLLSAVGTMFFLWYFSRKSHCCICGAEGVDSKNIRQSLCYPCAKEMGVERKVGFEK